MKYYFKILEQNESCSVLKINLNLKDIQEYIERYIAVLLIYCLSRLYISFYSCNNFVAKRYWCKIIYSKLFDLKLSKMVPNHYCFFYLDKFPDLARVQNHRKFNLQRCKFGLRFLRIMNKAHTYLQLYESSNGTGVGYIYIYGGYISLLQLKI